MTVGQQIGQQGLKLEARGFYCCSRFLDNVNNVQMPTHNDRRAADWTTRSKIRSKGILLLQRTQRLTRKFSTQLQL